MTYDGHYSPYKYGTGSEEEEEGGVVSRSRREVRKITMLTRISLGMTTTDINMQPLQQTKPQDDMKNVDSSDCQRSVVVCRSPITPAEQIQIDTELDTERKFRFATRVVEQAIELNYYISTNSSVSSLEGSCSEDNDALLVPEDSDDHSIPGLASFCHDSMPSLADIGIESIAINKDHKDEDVGSIQEPECTLTSQANGSDPSLVGMGPSRKESRWVGQRGRSDSMPCNPRRASCDNHDLKISPGRSHVHAEPGTGMDFLPTNPRRSSFDDVDLSSSLHTSSHHKRIKIFDQFGTFFPTPTPTYPPKSNAEVSSAVCADRLRSQRRKSFDETGDFLPTNPRMKVPGCSGSPEPTGQSRRSSMQSRRSSMQSRRSSCDTLPMVPLRGSYYDSEDESVQEGIE
jgi:hypothetical protein